jgi:pimeloyl-ACP methyl ester carboxylesterase
MRRYVDAMGAIPLTPELTRAAADAALVGTVPDAVMRGFLLQNLRFGSRPAWRLGLEEIAAAMPDIEGWPDIADRYDGPALFLAGARSDYIRPEHRPAIRALFPAARFVTLKDAGHWLHADNPSGFVAVVEAFLADY